MKFFFNMLFLSMNTISLQKIPRFKKIKVPNIIFCPKDNWRQVWKRTDGDHLLPGGEQEPVCGGQLQPDRWHLQSGRSPRIPSLRSRRWGHTGRSASELEDFPQ